MISRLAARTRSAAWLAGLDLSDVPGVNAFPGFNFSDGTGFTALGRDKTGLTRSRTLQFADNLSWIKGNHTMKFGVDVRGVGTPTWRASADRTISGVYIQCRDFTGNAYADLLLGLPSKSYIARSGPDTSAGVPAGLYAQDEWHDALLTFNAGLRWQALPRL